MAEEIREWLLEFKKSTGKMKEQTPNVVNGFAAMSFYYENIYRLADGEEAREEMALFPVFLRHQIGERRNAARLAR